ncbi:hypothetical protein GCM10027290_11230 [Micromonospora sonneratiae]|uniref:Uncharacterized protein n=1 Tax=Micromonospora sonneratiae TaxID=1184706 RepID=A0ABW3YJ44_9ACTN
MLESRALLALTPGDADSPYFDAKILPLAVEQVVAAEVHSSTRAALRRRAILTPTRGQSPLGAELVVTSNAHYK